MLPAPRSLHLVAALLGLGTAGLHASPASALSLAVQMACASDYYAYCAKHDPNGPGVRACMRANGLKLSDRCVNALIAAGEITQAEVDRRRAEAK